MRHAFGEQFDVPVGYLNTASIGIPPSSGAAAVAAAVANWRRGGARPTDFDEPGQIARSRWAELVGVDRADVAIGSTVSQLAGLVAASIPDGTRVLTVRNEYTSLTFPFAAQQQRGVRVDEVELAELPTVADSYDVVAVSVVQSADGRIVDLDRLRRTRAHVFLDVSQAVGWMPLRLDWATWVVGACYKWLLSPRGAAWLAVHPAQASEITPHSANWYAGDQRWDSLYGLPMRLAAGARGLDLSPAWMSQVGSAAALSWLGTQDLTRIREHCVGLADGLLSELGLAPRGSAIIALDAPDAAATLAAHGVVASTRAGRARLSFALYNTAEDVRAAVTALRS